MKVSLEVTFPGGVVQAIVYDLPAGTTVIAEIDGTRLAPAPVKDAEAARIARIASNAVYGQRASAAAILCGCRNPANHVEDVLSASDRARMVWGGIQPTWPQHIDRDGKGHYADDLGAGPRRTP